MAEEGRGDDDASELLLVLAESECDLRRRDVDLADAGCASNCCMFACAVCCCCACCCLPAAVPVVQRLSASFFFSPLQFRNNRRPCNQPNQFQQSAIRQRRIGFVCGIDSPWSKDTQPAAHRHHRHDTQPQAQPQAQAHSDSRGRRRRAGQGPAMEPRRATRVRRGCRRRRLRHPPDRRSPCDTHTAARRA